MIALVELLPAIARRLALPEHLASRAIDRQTEQASVANTGKEDVVAVNDRRGIPRRETGFPHDVAGWTEFHGQTGDFGDARSVRPAKSCPLAGSRRRGQQQRHHHQRLDHDHLSYSENGWGASGTAQITFVN